MSNEFDYSHLMKEEKPERDVVMADAIEADQSGLYVIVIKDEAQILVPLYQLFKALSLSNKMWYDLNMRKTLNEQEET